MAYLCCYSCHLRKPIITFLNTFGHNRSAALLTLSFSLDFYCFFSANDEAAGRTNSRVQLNSTHTHRLEADSVMIIIIFRAKLFDCCICIVFPFTDNHFRVITAGNHRVQQQRKRPSTIVSISIRPLLLPRMRQMLNIN